MAVARPLVMMFGAVGDMLGTGAAIIIAQSRQRQPAAGTAQPRQHAGLAGIVQPADDDCRQMFSDRYTPSVRRYRRTVPGAVRYSRILIYGNLAYMLVTGVLAVIRNDGRPVLSMWLMVGGLLLNIVMDYVFIFRSAAA